MSLTVTYGRPPTPQVSAPATPRPTMNGMAEGGGQIGFDADAYVAGMTPAQLMDLIGTGPNLATQQERLAAVQAAKRRMAEIAPSAPPDMNGMAYDGSQRAPTGSTAGSMADYVAQQGAVAPSTPQTPVYDIWDAPQGPTGGAQINAPDWGGVTEQGTYNFAPRGSQAASVGPAHGMDNFNNAAHSSWQSQYQDMMSGLNQNVAQQARMQGLLDDDQYVQMRGLLS